MKKHNVTKIFLGVLFLAMIGTVKMYGQEYTFGYYVEVKATTATPPHIDKNTLTEQDKAEMKDEEYEVEDCDKDDNFWLWGIGLIFDMDKDTRELYLQNFYGFQDISEQNGIVVGVMDEGDGERIELTIKLTELIFEMRLYYEGDDNLFFDTAGNYLWGIYRINFKRTNDGYVIPVKQTDIEYDELLSGIPYEITEVTTYLYYEVELGNNTIVKDGDENLFNDCMGYTSVKEIQQNTNITVYPNPTTGKIVVSGQLSDVNVEVFDIVGRNVGAYCIRPESNETTIDISHLSAGMYFLKIDNKMVKIIKE